MISNGYEALLRARRRGESDENFKKTYGRHRWQVEGMHGEAKTRHGLRRAVRRGLANVAIQAYLTAAVINLKRLATFVGLIIVKIRLYLRFHRTVEHFEVTVGGLLTNPERNFALRKAG